MTRDDLLAAESFSYQESKDALVLISHSDRIVKTLPGKQAGKFMAKIALMDQSAAQLLMAKVTGQFKFGNEPILKRQDKPGS
jgi:hypothetical protein